MAIRLTAASSQYLRTTGGPNYAANYTICGWVRFLSLPTLETFAEQCVVWVGDTLFPQSFDRIGLWGPFTRNRWTISTATGFAASDFDTETTAATPATGVSYHVAMVRSGDDVLLYVDGVLVITSTCAVSSRDVTDHVYLGTHNDAGTLTNFADAEFEGWRMFSTDLTAEQVVAEMHGGLTPHAATDLLAAWPMVEGANRSRDLLGVFPFTEGASPTDATARRGYGWPGPQVGAPSAAAADEIAGSVTGAATLAGAIVGRGAVAGGATGAATLAGAVTGRGVVAGAATGAASLTCALTARGAVAGAVTGAASLTAAVVGRGTLAAAVAGAAALVGAVVGRGVIAGSVTGAASLTGQFLTDGLQGNVTGSASLTCALTGRGLVAGTAAGAASLVAAVVGRGLLAGSATGTASLVGAIITSDRLAGAATGLASVVGAVVGIGELQGSTIAQAVASVTLTGPAPVVVGDWQPGPRYVDQRPRTAPPFYRW